MKNQLATDELADVDMHFARSSAKHSCILHEFDTKLRLFERILDEKRLSALDVDEAGRFFWRA